MIRSKPNKNNIRLNSIFWILAITIGLLVFKKADNDKSEYRGQSTPIEISVIKNIATVSTGIQYYHFQKIWIPNKDNFKLLTFDHSKFPDNSKADQKILILDRIRKKSPGFPIPGIYNQLFPEESDEIPILS